MSENGQRSAWQRFFDRGGWWKAVLVAAVYLGLYELVALLVGRLFAGQIDAANLFSSPVSVFVGLALPILVGAILLLIFTTALGWTGELFGRQPVRGRGWMWIAVAVPVGFNLLRFVSVDWAGWDGGTAVIVLFAGLCIGVAEELLTRGLAVSLLRKAGYGERAVMVLSAALFAALHLSNFTTGQSPLTVLFTVVYTFAFGITMYLVLRVTGNLIWPILVHATTDPSLILLVGGVDATTASLHPGPLAGVAGLANFVVIVVAIIGLIFVRGRAHDNDTPHGLGYDNGPEARSSSTAS